MKCIVTSSSHYVIAPLTEHVHVYKHIHADSNDGHGHSLDSRCNAWQDVKHDVQRALHACLRIPLTRARLSIVAAAKSFVIILTVPHWTLKNLLRSLSQAKPNRAFHIHTYTHIYMMTYCWYSGCWTVISSSRWCGVCALNGIFSQCLMYCQ